MERRIAALRIELVEPSPCRRPDDGRKLVHRDSDVRHLSNVATAVATMGSEVPTPGPSFAVGTIVVRPRR